MSGDEFGALVGFLLPFAIFAWYKYSQYKDNDTAEAAELRKFVDNNTPIDSYVGLYVYSDRLIRLQRFGPSQSAPIAGVTATIEETGGVSARSTLTRSAVPGMHGWQKKDDNRMNYIVVDGPDFQWQVEFAPQLAGNCPRKFIASLNTAARKAAADNNAQQAAG